jgi:hypothetical protein
MINLVMLFLLCGIILPSQDVTPDPLKDKGVLLLEVGIDGYLCVINTGYENGAYWFLIKESSGNRVLGNNLGQLAEVHQLMRSPNGKYLAVLSVGEGHPMVDVVDLPKLLDKGEYGVLQVLDPYPGYIGIDRWYNSQLVVDSTVPLHLRKEDGRVDPELLFSEPKKFVLNVSTGTIEPIHINIK